MFSKPIFETLPIMLIACGFLLAAFVPNVVTITVGITLIIASCYMIYRRVNEIGLSTRSDNEANITG